MDARFEKIMDTTFEITEYTEAGNSPFAEWFNSLDAVTAARVDKYIRRLEVGNFGATKSLDKGVFELKLDFGPGYRVYFGRDGKTIIILLGGGSKRRQSTDITTAIERWKRYKQTKVENGSDARI
jgi:putative addiction module killer protein